MLTELTTAALPGAPIQEFRAHLRLSDGFSDDDADLPTQEMYLRAATAAIEAMTGLALITRALEWRVAAWPRCVVLPMAPVFAVSEVALVGVDGIETILPSAHWTAPPDPMRPALARVGGALPAIPTGGYAAVRFDAGYGADWNAVPADLRQAVLMLGAHYYETRQVAVEPGQLAALGVEALVARHRPVRM